MHLCNDRKNEFLLGAGVLGTKLRCTTSPTALPGLSFAMTADAFALLRHYVDVSLLVSVFNVRGTGKLEDFVQAEVLEILRATDVEFPALHLEGHDENALRIYIEQVQLDNAHETESSETIEVRLTLEIPNHPAKTLVQQALGLAGKAIARWFQIGSPVIETAPVLLYAELAICLGNDLKDSTRTRKGSGFSLAEIEIVVNTLWAFGQDLYRPEPGFLMKMDDSMRKAYWSIIMNEAGRRRRALAGVTGTLRPRKTKWDEMMEQIKIRKDEGTTHRPWPWVVVERGGAN